MTTICFGLLVMVCKQGTTAPAGDLAFCDGYRPVYLSHRDTRETKRQADADNRVWKAFCGSRR